MKRILCILLIFINLILMIPALAEQTQEEILKSKESFNKLVEVPYRGQMKLYAQNSPEWDDMWYDRVNGDYKYFGNAGCVATAAANAIVNIVENSELENIRKLMSRPFMLDSVAMNINLGKPKRDKFVVEGDDLVRYFPLAIGQFASGNNSMSIKTLRSNFYYKYLFEAFDLRENVYTDLNEALKELDDRSIIIVSSGGKISPFAPIGHYFNIVSQDEEYVYAFDSYFRERYNFDKKKLIEVIEPGLIRFKKADSDKMALNKLIVVRKKER